MENNTPTIAPVIATAPVAVAPAPAQAAAAAPAKAKSPKVFAVIPEGANSPIVAYPNSPDYGYIQVQSTEIQFGVQWARPKKRSTLIKADIPTLKEIVRDYVGRDLSMKGKLIIKEYTLDELNEPENQEYKSRLDDTKDLADMIEPYVKRAGKGGPVLMLSEQPILRFTDYVHEPTEHDADRLLTHDNQAEVREFQAQQKEQNSGE